MEQISKVREIAPFFEDSVNQIFTNPDKTAFVMDGAVGTGKSTNFLMRSAYEISMCVEPTRRGNRMIRQSLWAGIRESENNAQATFLQLLEAAIFTPEIMSREDSPVQVYGTHPSYIMVKHDLPDGTELEMKIECHGFNNDKAFNRLKTREYMGSLIPEMQAIPYVIFETSIERNGRWRTEATKIVKVIDGVKYTLSGVTGLSMCLCDVNIPPRPHALYTNYYDNADKESLPFMYLTPPPPLLNFPVEKANDELKKKYPVTKFEGKMQIWVPNPKAYQMTRHFEELDSDGNKVPWSGYTYWLSKLHRSDSEIRRYIIGIPDTVGGESAVYQNFRKDSVTIVTKEPQRGKDIIVGYDPGGHAAIMIGQLMSGNHLHWFKEFIFEPVDRVSTRQQFSDYFLPYCRKNLQGFNIIIVPDPASSWLGKSVMTGQTESVVNMINEEIAIEVAKHSQLPISYKVMPCLVSNQAVSIRVNSLMYFIDKGKMSCDPGLTTFIAAMSGGYQYKKLKSGVVSDNIDKDHPQSHCAEAAQYPAVNKLNDIKKAIDAKQSNSSRTLYRVKRPR